jgi:putative transposase
MDLIDRQYLARPFYGSRRMAAWLATQGHTVNRKRVQRLMRLMGLVAIHQRPSTSKAAPEHTKYPYLLGGLTIDRVNQVWCTDITYIPLARGFVYLVAIMDWHSRAVLAWRISNTLHADFCVEALEEALRRFGRPEIFNTDQGSQFTSTDFTGVLKAHGIAIRYRGDRQHFSALAIGSDCQRVRSAQGHTACGGGLRPALIAAPRAGQDGRRSGRRGHRAGIEQRNRVIRGW